MSSKSAKKRKREEKETVYYDNVPDWLIEKVEEHKKVWGDPTNGRFKIEKIDKIKE